MNFFGNIKIGTRRSPLALAQAEIAINALKTVIPDYEMKVIPLLTEGDKIKNIPLYEIGGKSLFTKNLQKALLENKIDIAVHSLKDFNYPHQKGLCFGAFLKREDPSDILISKFPSIQRIKDLPPSSIIGTCAPRRIAQIMRVRPDLQLVPLRGNIQTRIRKLLTEKIDGIILASAGLKRLGIFKQNGILNHYSSLWGHTLPFSELLPAIGQGTIALEIRENNVFLKKKLDGLTPQKEETLFKLEQGILKALGGDCRTAIGCYSQWVNSQSVFISLRYAPDFKMRMIEIEKEFDWNSLSESITLILKEIRRKL